VRSFSVVRDVDVELLLELHDELDDVERVGAKVLDEARAVGQLVALDAQLLLDDVLDLRGMVGHAWGSRWVGLRGPGGRPRQPR